MAIDPRISLAVQQANIAPAIDLFQRTLQQQRANSIQDRLLPGQLQLQQQALAQGKQAIEQGELSLQASRINIDNEEDKRDLRSLAEFSTLNKPLFEEAVKGNVDPLRAALETRVRQLGPERATQSAEALRAINSNVPSQISLALRGFQNAENLAKQTGLLGRTETPAALREFQTTVETAGLTPEEKQQAARIKLGLQPRATGSASQTIAAQGTAEEVAEVEKTIKGAGEEGRLTAKLKLQPEIESAVKGAVAQAVQAADKVKEERSDSNAFSVYEVGINGLRQALGDTSTGPFVGALPAITSEARTADGAIAAMAPILKQMFRSAGEGTFTDKDQELLVAMIPTRKDSPETRQSKLANIDAIVRAKLRQPEQQEPRAEQAQPQTGTIGRFTFEVID